MDAVPLEKAPKVAVYAPPNAAPWDDAVTMALNYAGIKFEKIWDAGGARRELKTYDWLHLHHEDFTGQYSKFFLNYAGAPWLVDMVERNRAHGPAARLPHRARREARGGRGHRASSSSAAASCSPCAPRPRRSSWRSRPTSVDIAAAYADGTPMDPDASAADALGARRSPSRTRSWS